MSLARLGGAADWVRYQRLGARMMWRLVPRRRFAGDCLRRQIGQGRVCSAAIM